MAEIKAWACALTDAYLPSWKVATLYLGAIPLGHSFIGVTNWADVPVRVVSVCRSDYGRDFRDLPEVLEIGPERTAWVDYGALPSRWPVLDPDTDYKLASEFAMWSADGHNWRFGTGPDNDLGPIIARPALHDLDFRRIGRKYS
jgi:hypothetical protein